MSHYYEFSSSHPSWKMFASQVTVPLMISSPTGDEPLLRVLLLSPQLEDVRHFSLFVRSWPALPQVSASFVKSSLSFFHQCTVLLTLPLRFNVNCKFFVWFLAVFYKGLKAPCLQPFMSYCNLSWPFPSNLLGVCFLPVLTFFYNWYLT